MIRPGSKEGVTLDLTGKEKQSLNDVRNMNLSPSDGEGTLTLTLTASDLHYLRLVSAELLQLNVGENGYQRQQSTESCRLCGRLSDRAKTFVFCAN